MEGESSSWLNERKMQVYTENSTPLIITGNLSLSDVDDTNIESATVTISSNFAAAEDVLAFTDQPGITGSYDSATGTLTLTGSASVADYQAAIRSITYSNSSNDPSTLTRTVRFEINDGDSVSNNLSRDIEISAVNDAPALASIEVLPALYTENDVPVNITGNLSLSDVDDLNIESATVTISNNFAIGEDELIFVDQSGITGSYDSTDGMMTLTGSATIADYQAALRSVTYGNTSDNPSALTRTINFEINDGDGSSNTLHRDIDLTIVNDAPALTTIEALPTFYTENNPPRIITGNLSLSDVDDVNIESATVTISNNFAAGEDELIFSDQSGITGFYDTATGVMTLTGSASVADYQTALRSIGYSNSSDNPSDATRTVSFNINDGGLDSNTLSRDISFTPVNDAPALSNTETLAASYAENDVALVITSATTASDPDDSSIESAIISISSNFASGEDILNFTSQSGIVGSYDINNGVLTLTGSATLADYQTAIQSITYENTSNNPSDVDRTVSIVINDGDNNSNTVVRDIEITAINDAPVLTTIEALPTIYTENGAPTIVSGNLSLADVDNLNIDSATVSISNNFAIGEDELTFTDQSGISGSYDASTGVMILTGSASIADYQAAIRTVAYTNTSDAPSTLTRSVSFDVSDGELNSNVLSRDISLAEVNDRPELAALEADPVRYVENQQPVAITSSLIVNDIDSATLESARIAISNNYNANQDSLSFIPGGNISGLFDSTSGVLSLSGTASAAEYQQAIRSITYLNSSENPSTLPRAVEITVSDSESQSVSLSRTVAIEAVNDAPAGTDNLISFFEDTAYTLTIDDFGFTDSLDNHNFKGINIQVLPVLGSLTLNGNDVSIGQFIPASDISTGQLIFTPKPDATGIAYDSLGFRTVDDGGTNLNGVDTSVGTNQLQFNVTNINDAPSGTDNTIAVVEDTVYQFGRADFGFTDVLDGNEFHAITISMLPKSGFLTLNGAPVLSGTIIELPLIDSGQLQYIPSQNAHGSNFNGFSFKVHDDGGTLNGGLAVDPTENFISFDIPGVNDSPLLVTEATAVDEGSETTLTTNSLNAIDSDDLLPEELTFTLNSLPLNGTLTLNGQPATTGTEFTLEQLLQDQLIYTHDGSETSTDFFDLQVSDGGEDGSTPAAGRFTFLINEIIDPAPLIDDESMRLAFGGEFDSLLGSKLESGESTLASDSLSDNPRLVVTIESQPTNGSVAIAPDGTFIYTHNGGSALQDSFSYRVTNEDGVHSVATVSISIEPPVANAFANPLTPLQEQIQLERDPIEQLRNPEEALQVEEALEPDQGTDQTETTNTQDEDQSPIAERASSSQINFDLTENSVAFLIETDSLYAIDGVTTREIENFDPNQRDRSQGLRDLGVRLHNSVEYTELQNYEVTSLNPLSFNIQTEIDARRVQEVVSNRQFLNGLKQLEQDVLESENAENKRYRLATDGTIGVSLSATAGVLAWVLRGGALFASAMAYTPMWSSIDPVRVMTGKRKDKNKVQESEVEKYFS